MFSKLIFAKKYLQHYLHASGSRGHGIHSPFVFDFVKNVLNDKRDFYAYHKIEELREQLLHDHTAIEVDDMGAGSTIIKKNSLTVADIARNSAVPAKLGQLLFRIANHYQPQTILELGTSLGLSASYLSSGNNAAKLITCEGSDSVASIAAKNFKKLGLHNIELVGGNFDEILPLVFTSLAGAPGQPVIDFAYIDGNHRKEPTLTYFDLFLPHMTDSSLIIFDDIHWSSEMEEAWSGIKNDKRVLLTVDLFFFGLVFFRKDFKIKQHFNIRCSN